jgi:hypothetical protein
MGKLALNRAIEYDVLPRAYDSNYVNKSGYNKHIRRLENEIRRNVDTGGSGEGVGYSSQRRAGDYAAVVEQIKDIATEQESAFRKWTKDARDLATKRRIQVGEQEGPDSGQRYSPGRRSESTGDGGGERASGYDPRNEAPLVDAPKTKGATGPDQRVVKAAERYARSAGIDLKRQANYVDVDKERAVKIAKAYEDMVDDPSNQDVSNAYRDLIKQTVGQYQALADEGFSFYFFDGENDPYGEEDGGFGNPYNAIRDLRMTGVPIRFQKIRRLRFALAGETGPMEGNKNRLQGLRSIHARSVPGYSSSALFVSV